MNVIYILITIILCLLGLYGLSVILYFSVMGIMYLLEIALHYISTGELKKPSDIN